MVNGVEVSHRPHHSLFHNYGVYLPTAINHKKKQKRQQ